MKGRRPRPDETSPGQSVVGRALVDRRDGGCVSAEDANPRVIIVGGGIAGLTAAFRLCGDAHVDVLEAAPSLGGQIRTQLSAGFAIERGAEGFVFRSEAVPALAADLDMPDELMGQSVSQSYGFGDGGLRVLALGEAAAFLGFQVPTADLGKAIEEEL